ncbi:MAG: thiamine pyrophosphokinae [Candidatus Midichloriaceae bacterium]|nr:thiamine pyrophosphokinae [Candidatus Midichloriaceae bacterium]
MSILKRGKSRLEYQVVADSPVKDFRHLNKLGNIICLDGAIHELLVVGIIPEYLIGDFDSVDEGILKEVASLGVKVIYDENQITTDLEKGLELAAGFQAGARKLTIKIFQGFAGRVDHSLYNLGLLKKFHKVFNELLMVNGDEIISYHENEEIEVVGEVGAHMAIMGFPSAEVSSTGLKYDMQNLILEIGGMQSASNSLAVSKANIKITGCALIVRGINITQLLYDGVL